MMQSNRQVVEYGICSAYTAEELAGYVNDQISLGFELYQAVFVSFTEQLKFHQAMVKYAVAKPAPAKKPAKKRNEK